ncbi:MAG: alpha/beta hydrolase, partial [Brevundimonas sp.]
MIPIVLAPGLLCDDRLWSAVGPLLARSPMTVDFGGDDTIEAMADRILAEGPERFVLAGFSMGG